MIIFYKNGLKYKIEQRRNESKRLYDDRVLFISSQNPRTNKHLQEVLTYANIYINVKYLYCTYPDDVTRRLNWFIRNM